MLEEIKLSLRINNSEFDKEISALIEAAQEDLKTSGVNINNINKPLAKQAVTLYCKALFGYDNSDSEKFMQAYEHIKKKISISYSESESDN